MTDTADVQDIANLKLDAEAAENIVNGPSDFGGTGYVTTRLGEVVPTMAKVAEDAQATADIEIAAAEAAKEASETIVEAAGVVSFFDTKAAADLAVGSLAENDVVMVFVDETSDSKRVYYRKETGALVKKVELPRSTDFDFATMAEITAAAAAGELDAGRDFFVVGGYTAANDCPLMVYGRTAVDPLHDLEIDVQGGTWLEYVMQSMLLPSSHGGAQEGADNITAFRRCSEYLTYGGAGDVGQIGKLIIDQKYSTISDTWAITDGVQSSTDFQRIEVEGGGIAHNGETTFGGGIIEADFRDGGNNRIYDRPIIAIQGGRDVRLAGMTIDGGIDYDAEFDFDGLANRDMLDIANWDALGGAGRYRPYGLMVDPWAGTEQAEDYATPYVPARHAPGLTWGRALSSKVIFEQLLLTRMNTGIGVQPADVSGNGDFVKVRDCEFRQVPRGFSIGTTQGRNAECRNLVFSDVHTCFTNNAHGQQQGKFGAALRDISTFGFVKQVFDFGTLPILGAGTSIENLYCEKTWQLGTLRDNSTTDPAFKVEHFEIDVRAAQTDALGVPTFLIDAPDGTQASVILENGRITSAGPVRFEPAHMEFDDVNTVIDEALTGPIAPHIAMAHNASLGIERNPYYQTPGKITSTLFNVDTGAAINTGRRTIDGAFRDGKRDRCLPDWIMRFIAGNSIRQAPIEKIMSLRERTLSNSGHITSASLSGKTLSVQFASLTDDEAMRWGALPGDRIIHRESGTLFRIRNRTGVSVTADMLTNFYDAGGSNFQPIDTVDLTTGNLQLLNSRHYCLSEKTKMTFTSGSNIATDVGRVHDGFSAYLDTDLAVGDYLAIDGGDDLILFEDEAEITAIDGVAGTVTFSGNARLSGTFVLNQFIRAGAPNV